MHYTIVAMPDQGGADKRNLRVLDDELKPVSPDKARVRVINAIPGNGEISVFVCGRADPLFDGINFKSEASAAQEERSGTRAKSQTRRRQELHLRSGWNSCKGGYHQDRG